MDLNKPLDFGINTFAVFYRDLVSEKVKLALYVDDGIVAATDECELLKLIEKLISEFKITTKRATHFLGTETDQRFDGPITSVKVLILQNC